MAVIEKKKELRDTHAGVQVMKCPNCGNELRFSRRTISVTCKCGKTYKLQNGSSSRI